ncbi:DUF4303 domain-containing protein [Paenibacillus luteus]|uniref:DUF4303 domain-containing protein n=1 Tax=Paenibacillus luteus TaxID=2545753 RepID=UPI00137622B9|nr:DUF4303 domain-containing protein [Paenibacillus luteus]
MNLYYTEICQLLNGDRELENSGYFVKTDDGRIVQSDTVLIDVQVVTLKELEDALYEGCIHIVNEFISTNNNKDVYAFNLYADEYNSFYVYLNTEQSFEEHVERHYATDTKDSKLEIKYNQGDFTYQFFPSDMGKMQELIEGCEHLAYSGVQHNEDLEDLLDCDRALIAYEKKIFNGGFYLAAFNALKRIGNTSELDKLHKTDNFIFYAATGHDYIDYSLLMRKTIDLPLFYSCFPDLKTKDDEFDGLMKSINSKNIIEIVDFMEIALQGEFNEGSPYEYIKMEYQVFDTFKNKGGKLAAECTNRLEKSIIDDLTNNVNRNKIEIYLKALEFIQCDEEIVNRLQVVLSKVRDYPYNEFLSGFFTQIQSDIGILIRRNSKRN